MNSSVLKNIVAEWLEEWKLPPLVKRETVPVDLVNLPEILAVVGPRRAGKTFFMYQLIGQLLEGGIAREEILFVDFEDYRLTNFTPADMESLFTAFYQLTDRHPTYLFFDEIQKLTWWSRVVRTLHNRQRYRIVVSGSSSRLSTREIPSELRGRYRDILILPFSFRELLRLKQITHDQTIFYTAARGKILQAFDEYLQVGGFPAVAQRSNLIERRDLLQSYYHTLFYRDLIEQYNIRSRGLLETIMTCCLDTFGSLFSISRFADQLRTHNLPGSKKTISNYLHYLQESFFILLVDKFDYSPRKRLMNPKKLYLLDVGFASLATAFSENRGRLLENIVAIELFRRRMEMFYFKKRYECDFILKSGTRVQTAIQVCWELNEFTRKRELRGLREALRVLKLQSGLILTYNQEGEENIAGVSVPVLPVWKWLLEREDNT
jgi:hypothetical protein